MIERFGREWQLPTEDLDERAVIFKCSDGEALVFDKRNTFLRVFAVGEGQYDHIVHYSPFEEQIRAWLYSPKIAELRAHFMTTGFPVQYEDYPDQLTLDWHAHTIGLENQAKEG